MRNEAFERKNVQKRTKIDNNASVDESKTQSCHVLVTFGARSILIGTAPHLRGWGGHDEHLFKGLSESSCCQRAMARCCRR